jgi:hypothetical protein
MKKGIFFLGLPIILAVCFTTAVLYSEGINSIGQQKPQGDERGAMASPPAQAPIESSQLQKKLVFTVRPKVVSVNVASVTLVQGGSEVTAEFQGNNFDKITSLTALFNGSPSAEVQIRIIKAGSTACQVGFRATAAAPIGTYALRVIAGKEDIDIPTTTFKVEVTAPRTQLASKQKTLAQLETVPALRTAPTTAPSIPPPTINSLDLILTGYTLNGSNLYSSSASLNVYENATDVTSFVTEKTGTKLVVTGSPFPLGPIAVKVKVGDKESTLSYNNLPPTISAINQVGDAYEIIGSRFGNNAQLITVIEKFSTGTTVNVPAQSITLNADSKITINRLPPFNTYEGNWYVTVKVQRLSSAQAQKSFYYKPEIVQINFTDKGWEIVGNNLASYTVGKYFVDGHDYTAKISSATLVGSPQKWQEQGFASPGTHTHKIQMLNNPDPYKESNTFTATHPTIPTSAIPSFSIQASTRTPSPGAQLAISVMPGFSMSWKSFLAFRWVEMNKPLNFSTPQEGLSTLTDALLQLPSDVPFGTQTIEASIETYKTSCKIYVVPSPLPAVSSVSGGVAGPAGKIVIKDGDDLKIMTTGQYDYAKVELWVNNNPASPNSYNAFGPRTFRRTANGEIVFHVSGPNTVTPIAGPGLIIIQFALDAVPPSGWSVSSILSENRSTAVYYANVPMLKSASTPGAPTIVGYNNPVFPNLDFNIDGLNLLVEGFTPTVKMDSTPLQVQPGSTATRLIVRVPSSSTVGGFLSVNNGFRESLGPAYLYGSNVYATVVVPEIVRISPTSVAKGAANYEIKVEGNFLGLLADSASLNGVAGSVQLRAPAYITVLFPNTITTGDIIVKTKSGDAKPATTGTNRLTVY